MIIGIGCDVTFLSKFTDKKQNFIDKVLTTKEKELYNKRKGKKKIEFLAGHFSAKESIIKALSSVIKINFLDIEILYNDEAPFVNINYCIVYISISHDGDIVMTNAIAMKKWLYIFNLEIRI